MRWERLPWDRATAVWQPRVRFSPTLAFWREAGQLVTLRRCATLAPPAQLQLSPTHPTAC